MCESATVNELDNFKAILDVRTPAEFAEDHIPGAQNYPVLTDEERAIVGTIYKQHSPFEARRIGGAWVARNIGHTIETYFQDKPRDWRPLVYCWRGGQRSGAFVTWLRLIGWDAVQLVGGYKAFRRHVLTELSELPKRFRYIVVAGPTGCGKTRLLAAIEAAGGQVLDLETIARHRGSLLGRWPDGSRQPTQKAFETAIWDRLRRFDPGAPIFLEAESRRIGRCHIPDPLWHLLQYAPQIRLSVPFSVRIEYILQEYYFWRDDPSGLTANLARLQGVVANDLLSRWCTWAREGNLEDLFADLILHHYDPLYQRTLARWPAPILDTIELTTLSPSSLAQIADQILASTKRR